MPALRKPRGFFCAASEYFQTDSGVIFRNLPHVHSHHPVAVGATPWKGGEYYFPSATGSDTGIAARKGRDYHFPSLTRRGAGIAGGVVPTLRHSRLKRR